MPKASPTRSRRSSQSVPSVPANPIAVPATPAPAARSQPTPRPTTTDEPQRKPIPSLEEQEAAAVKIQTIYRTRLALSHITSIEAEFDQLKSSFEVPQTLDFADGAAIVSLPTSIQAGDTSSERAESAKLAYTARNAPLHLYVHTLSQILTKLDGVESHGVKRVRSCRREVVRRVEAEAERIEGIWR
ncbi:hypothetical protein FIBSPDRAFT_762673, partial [Athelia psychrophila]